MIGPQGSRHLEWVVMMGTGRKGQFPDRLKEASMELSSGVDKEGKGEGRPKGNMEALNLGMERKHLTNRNSR